MVFYLSQEKQNRDHQLQSPCSQVVVYIFMYLNTDMFHISNVIYNIEHLKINLNNVSINKNGRRNFYYVQFQICH